MKSGMTRILLLAIALTFAPFDANAKDSGESAAQRAISTGRFAEAREIYRQLLVTEPEKVIYLNWVARLSAWLKEYPVALTNYDLALANEPENFEALVGKAYVLMWQGKFNQSEDLLQLAARDDSNQVAWHIAMFSFFNLQGKSRQARHHLLLVHELDPANAEAGILEKQLNDRQPIIIQTGFEQNRVNDLTPNLPALNSVFVNLTLRGERGDISVRFENDSYGNLTSKRIGWGISQRLGSRLWVRSNALFAYGERPILKQDISGGLAVILPRGFVVSGDYRRLNVLNSTTHVVSPTIEYTQKNGSHWQATIYKSWQPYSTSSNNTASSQTLLMRYDRQISIPLKAGFIWTHTRQQLSSQAHSTVTNYVRNGYSIAAEYAISSRASVNVNYGFFKNTGGASQNVIGISLTTKWPFER